MKINENSRCLRVAQAVRLFNRKMRTYLIHNFIDEPENGYEIIIPIFFQRFNGYFNRTFSFVNNVAFTVLKFRCHRVIATIDYYYS